MRHMVIRISLFSIALSLFLFPAAIASAQENMKMTLAKITSEQNQLRAEITSLKDDLKKMEWERNSNKQIIEHLKDAQNSSLWWINFILACVLGVFTVIGVVGGLVAFGWTGLGIRSLRTFNDKYETGLQDFEKRKQDITRQNNAIRSLKPIFRALKYSRNNDHRRARFYIDRALHIDPESDVALHMKFWSLIETGQVVASMQLLQELHEMHPSDPDAVVSSLELFLLTGKLEQYKDNAGLWQNLLKEYDEMENGLLLKYFDALYLYMTKDFKSMKQSITDTLNALIREKVTVDFDWDFSEVRMVLASGPDTKDWLLLHAFLEVLEKKMPPDILISMLSQHAFEPVDWGATHRLVTPSR
jgi:tetratricopeptide (TPR) repeat protein